MDVSGQTGLPQIARNKQYCCRLPLPVVRISQDEFRPMARREAFREFLACTGRGVEYPIRAQLTDHDHGQICQPPRQAGHDITGVYHHQNRWFNVTNVTCLDNDGCA